MKTFQVSLSVDCRLTLEVDAEDEQAARQKAAAQVRDGEHCLDNYVREIAVDDIEDIS